LLVSASNNSTARVIRGFRIRQDTIAHLGPMEQVWARRLISQGVWRLVPDDEA